MPRKAKRKYPQKKDSSNDKRSPPKKKLLADVNGESTGREKELQTPPQLESSVNNDSPETDNKNNEASAEIIITPNLAKEIQADIQINRLFDHIRYSEEATSVLPNRSWAIHCTEVPVKHIVISEMVIDNIQGRGLEPFYIKQVIFNEKLNFELLLLNSRAVLKDKPPSVRSMADFEAVLDHVNSMKLCAGGPYISQYSNINPECAYRDPYSRWRHNLCALEVNDCDVCESCSSLEEILKRHAQRVKSPLKSRNGVLVPNKRKRL